ncbi:aminopeptidase PepB [Thalassotalea hakodatensis]|uniref:aminopeptidase PepB n=1 Tax=Thalassotalea hakodatensis TaxID=3030492 RepID=UPI002572A148|nr:aminopeptidase PepB [Thalassotalea hakodatensis]
MKQGVLVHLINDNKATDWQQNKTIQHINGEVFLYFPEFDNYSERNIQKAARKLESMGLEQVALTGGNWQESYQWAFAQGFSSINKSNNIHFTGEPELINKLSNKLMTYAWAKRLTNQTAAEQSPEILVSSVFDYVKALSPEFVSMNVIKGEALNENGWVGVYNVGKASQHAPCLAEIDFNPTGNSAAPIDVCLVGKGITFDTGGYSIKSNEGMFNMKCDMGGVAVVAAALAYAIQQGLTKRVKLILCCAENMISGSAYKVSDILTYKNGVTCEIANTDAEGRLVLADGLLLASESSPKMIIDAATLTGAAMLATGGDYTALMSLDSVASERALVAAKAEGEPLWPLPLAPWHQEKCPSAFADTANSRTQKGGGMGGASNAAGFLSRFVPNDGKGWLHFDLAAAYNGSANSLWAAGATGMSIATIANLLLNNK